MMKIKGDCWEGSSEDSYPLLSIFTWRGLFTHNKGKLEEEEKNSTSVCLLHHDLLLEEK